MLILSTKRQASLCPSGEKAASINRTSFNRSDFFWPVITSHSEREWISRSELGRFWTIANVLPSGEKTHQPNSRRRFSITTRGRGGRPHCQKPTPRPTRTAKRTPSRVGFRADRNGSKRWIIIPSFCQWEATCQLKTVVLALPTRSRMEVSKHTTQMLKVKCWKDNILTRQGEIFKFSCDCAKRGCATTFGGTSEIQVESPLKFIGCGCQQVLPDHRSGVQGCQHCDNIKQLQKLSQYSAGIGE